MAEELSEEEQQRRLQKILNQKKKTDLAGLLKAQRDGTLDEYLAADLEKAGLSARPSETQQTVVRRSAAAGSTARSGSQRESEDAPAWARAVERISQTGTSSAPQSSYYVEDELDGDYEGGYDESDDGYEHVQADTRPTDSGVPAWLKNKREPTAPTSARPYSINLTGAAQQQGGGQYYDDQGYDQGYEDQYYDDENPYDYGDNYHDQDAYDNEEYAADYQSYSNTRTQTARRYQDEQEYEDDTYEYEDIDPRQASPPPERTLSNPGRTPPAIPSSRPVDNEPMPAWAAEPESEQKQQQPAAEPVVATAPKPRAVDETTLKYAKYLSGVSVMVGMLVFVMVIIDMAVGFKDKSKYFVAIFVMILALGMLLFETKSESFTRFVAEKFGFMFFPIGRFCFNFLIATLCFGLGIAGIITGAITTGYAFGTAWIMILYPALPQHIRDRHGVDMFSSTGPIVRKDLALAAAAATAAVAASAASPSAAGASSTTSVAADNVV